VPAPNALAAPVGLFAYGPVPGVELIPYFLALLAWIGLALGTLVLSPFRAVIRLIRGPRAAAPPVPIPEPARAPAAPPVPEQPVEAPRPND